MTRLTGAVFLLTTACAGAAAAQTTPPPTPAPAVEAGDPFEQAMAARAVADFARRAKDPHAFIVAARMLQEVPMSEGVVDGAAPQAARDAFGPAALFDEARALAKDDPTLLMQISLAQSAGSRGVVSSAFGTGLVRIVQDMTPRARYAFPVKAKGGAQLRIGAIGGPTTKMVMRIRDQKGKVVCIDDSGDYAPVCSIAAVGAGDYNVEILNQSDTASRTVILSN